MGNAFGLGSVSVVFGLAMVFNGPFIVLLFKFASFGDVVDPSFNIGSSPSFACVGVFTDVFLEGTFKCVVPKFPKIVGVAFEGGILESGLIILEFGLHKVVERLYVNIPQFSFELGWFV